MKILVIANPSTLDSLKKELPKTLKFTELNHNAYLMPLGHRDSYSEDSSETSVCFGYYYNEIDPSDNRYKNKKADVVIETGLSYKSIADRHIHLKQDSDVGVFLDVIENLFKKEEKKNDKSSSGKYTTGKKLPPSEESKTW